MNFKNKIILAPLAGVTDIAFRKLCTDCGADIVYSQMIDSEALIRGNVKLADFYDEKNVVAQLLGNNPEQLAECAKIIEKKVQAIDINLGCPHSKVVDRVLGSYLLKFPDKIEAIIKKLKREISIPLTIKIRLGYDKNNINAVKIAKLAEGLGINAIAVHGRARTVNYETPVDYNLIKQVKDAVKVPIIGNGDIFDGKSAKEMFEKTGVDSIMVGRGAMGNPMIFKNIKSYLKKGNYPKQIQKKTLFKKYLAYAVKYNIPFERIKFHAQWFTKGLTGGAQSRVMINNAKSIAELKEIYSDF